MNYGDNLMFLKDRNGLTNGQMANIIKISDSLYSRYEKEKQIIPIKHLNTYSNYFGISIDYLLGFTNIKKYEDNNPEINKLISGKRLKKLRKSLNLTQKQFAQNIKTNISNISKYENGKHLISIIHLYNIGKKYNISADYLLGKSKKFHKL